MLISLGRVEIVNLPLAYNNLYCKGELYRLAGSFTTNRQHPFVYNLPVLIIMNWWWVRVLWPGFTQEHSILRGVGGWRT